MVYMQLQNIQSVATYHNTHMQWCQWYHDISDIADITDITGQRTESLMISPKSTESKVIFPPKRSSSDSDALVHCCINWDISC